MPSTVPMVSKRSTKTRLKMVIKPSFRRAAARSNLKAISAQGLEVAGYVERLMKLLQPSGNAGYSDGNVLSQAVCFWTHSPKPANEGAPCSICGGAGEEPAQDCGGIRMPGKMAPRTRAAMRIAVIIEPYTARKTGGEVMIAQADNCPLSLDDDTGVGEADEGDEKDQYRQPRLSSGRGGTAASKSSQWLR